MCSWSCVLQYQRDRRAEVKQSMDLDGEHLFHDGHDVLNSVHDMHQAVFKKVGLSDHITVKILQLVDEEMLLNEEEPRYSAKQVFHKSKRIIKATRRKSQSPTADAMAPANEDPEDVTDIGEPQTPPCVPPGYVRGSSPSAWRRPTSPVGTVSSGRPMSIYSTKSFSSGARSTTFSRQYHTKASNFETLEKQGGHSIASSPSQSIGLHDLPDPPSPASSYQSPLEKFNALTIRTQDPDCSEKAHRPHRGTVGDVFNGTAKKAIRETSLRRSQTEKKSSAYTRCSSVSSFGSQSGAPSPVQNHALQLPTPPPSMKKHHRSKSTPEADKPVSPEPSVQEYPEEPLRPHLSLHEGLLWKQRKKDGFSTSLSGLENLAYLNERDHVISHNYTRISNLRVLTQLDLCNR